MNTVIKETNMFIKINWEDFMKLLCREPSVKSHVEQEHVWCNLLNNI